MVLGLELVSKFFLSDDEIRRRVNDDSSHSCAENVLIDDKYDVIVQGNYLGSSC